MKIVDKSLNEEKEFQYLSTADIFKYDGRVFMKVSEDYDGQPNAYDFSKDRLIGIDGCTIVKYVPSELILHERGWGEKKLKKELTTYNVDAVCEKLYDAAEEMGQGGMSSNLMISAREACEIVKSGGALSN